MFLQKTDYRIPNDHNSVVNYICCYLLQKLTYQRRIEREVFI